MEITSFFGNPPYKDIKKTKCNFQKQMDSIFSEFIGSPLTRSNADILSSKIFELYSSFINIDPERITFRLGVTEDNEIHLLLYGDLEMIFAPFKDEYLHLKNDYSIYKEIF